MADREALRRAAMVAAPMAASPDQMPEPEPEVIAGADAEAEAEAEPTPEAASTWRRVRRIVRGDAAAQHTSAEE